MLHALMVFAVTTLFEAMAWLHATSALALASRDLAEKGLFDAPAALIGKTTAEPINNVTVSFLTADHPYGLQWTLM